MTEPPPDSPAAPAAPTRYPSQERRLVFAMGENTRHLRHEDLLEKWPLLDEPWALEREEARLARVDRTPAAATFGR